MATVAKYKTLTDYPSEQGFNQLLYPVRDALAFINPYFVILMGIWMVFTVAGYYNYVALSGKTRIFNSLLASSFSVMVLSMFFALGELVSPYVVLTFIGITAVSFALVQFYKR
jgi:hypothetical protein